MEIPLRSINVDHPVPSTSAGCFNQPAIIDLCDSPKKCPPVQSRLSHFFRKPKSDEVCEKEISNEKVIQTNQFEVETNSQSLLNASISNNS